MPLTHLRTVRVRHYECDVNGHVSQANYLRYMQEAAFDATAAAGYDLARYEAMNRYWLARETDIEYLSPLRYGDAVQVKTWVADFRRVRSRRAYELRLAASGDVVARALTDWVFLNLATGRPVAIPSEMMAAFLPDGPPPAAAGSWFPPRTRFPPPPPPPPGVFRNRRRVEWRDLDQAGHVNNAVYLAYMEDCALQAAAAHGWSLERMRVEGIAIIARRHRIEYQQPAVLDDELEVSTWASDLKNATALRHFVITRTGDGALVARARTFWVFADAETGRPIRTPEGFLADLAENITQEPASGETTRRETDHE